MQEFSETQPFVRAKLDQANGVVCPAVLVFYLVFMYNCNGVHNCYTNLLVAIICFDLT